MTQSTLSTSSPDKDGNNSPCSCARPHAAQACCQSFVLHTPSEFDEGARYNIFRDSPLRYMGYCNEIGESFRYQFPRFVVPSYILSFGYVGADALTTGYREYCSEDTSKDSKASLSREYRAGIATFDTLLWQSLASVMIPGLAINLVVKASRFAVARSPVSLPAFAIKWLPTASGIGSIPLIIHPIDSFVDFTLDNSTRAWLAKNTLDENNNEGDSAASK
eukprot:CAMPEP_0197727298 /NCGR_PEP_ID=MMETSP1434-20131217/18845_1 /TAXON_ID=265543 /ORGANISM="Minutocellus polymorphus, Strain CCMP3303" /LENGTH=219 /DNA_ID=CAMNT_0043313445 /DNA_START=102 /DNA_END=761 /DNA_ORIENTATION=+